MPTILPAISRRRSIRHFEARPVEPELIDAMLEAARLAPSAANLQNARILPVTDEADRVVLGRAAYSFGAVPEAPLVMVLMADTSRDAVFLEQMAEMAKQPNPPIDFAKLRSGAGKPFSFKLGPEWGLVNAGLAGQSLMLQAVEMGLGTCWVHHFEHDEVREHFKIPDHFILMSLMAIGYPATEPHPMERTDLRWTPTK